MQEQQHQIKIYGFFQKLVYFIVTLDCIALLLYGQYIPLLSKLLNKFTQLGVFFPPLHAKLFTLLFIALVAIGTKAKKKRDLNVWKEIVIPIGAGLGIMIVALFIGSNLKNKNEAKTFKIQTLSNNYEVAKIQNIFSNILNSKVGEIGEIKESLAKDRIKTDFVIQKGTLTQIYFTKNGITYPATKIGINPKVVQEKILDSRNNPGRVPMNLENILYVLLSFIGAVVVQVGADSVSKYMQSQIGKDRWNTEEESFEQNTEKIENPDVINIPYLFRYNKKNNNGWINLNPFRGTMVIGTPGSGKSFGIIVPAMKQMIQKNYCLCIYDFKFPDLAVIAYYHYRKKKMTDKDYKHNFHVINLNNVSGSRRVNPFKKKYINNLAKAQEMAEAMVSSLQKGGSSSGGGSDAFFTQSAINFLSSCIYFFSTYQNGKYSDLPHILAFMNLGYDQIFKTLFTNQELSSLLSPFKTAYENKAFDQLEGQVGTLKIFISRLDTKESAWVFSGDDIDLKITDPNNPSILVLSSDPQTQDITSALYSSVLNRTLSEINSKGNLRGGIVADELPTIYIHKIDNIVATARSNKIAVLLGLQELPQLRQFYKKEVAETITAIMGNIISGSARDKNTLDWLEKMFGKIKQKTYSQSVSQQGGTTMNTNEQMHSMIPAGKIAALRTGEVVGMIAGSEETETTEYKTSAISGKITLNMEEIKTEEQYYPKLKEIMPKYYDFVEMAYRMKEEQQRALDAGEQIDESQNIVIRETDTEDSIRDKVLTAYQKKIRSEIKIIIKNVELQNA